MRVRIESTSTRHLVELDGRFDAHGLAQFRGTVEALLTGAPQVRIDLRNVVFVDSSALAEMVRLQKEVIRRGGTLVLQDVSDPVRAILEITALEQVFTLESSPEAAAS